MTIHPISIESAGGEYMESVLVISWSVKAGEKVRAGDLLVTVETAKAATEVEADRDGWLAEIHYQEGQEAPVGAVLGTISDSEPQAAAGAVTAVASAATEAGAPTPATAPATSRQGGARLVASPLARRLASQAGIDLSSVSGSGPNGRIKQRDIQTFLDLQKARSFEASAQAPAAITPAAPAIAVRQARPPIVLLHGFGADKSAWRQVLPLLDADARTITIDLPAHGSSTGARAESVEDLASFVSDQLEGHGIEQAHIVGHSLGGATALALTSVGRIAARSLTLLAPGGLGPEISGGFISGLTGSGSAAALERWLAFMLAEAATLPQGYATGVLRQMEKVGNRTALDALAGRLFCGDTQLFDGLPALSRLTVPTRIVWGRADRVIPCSHALRAPDFAAVHLLSGVGHVPQMEAPGLTARLIMETVRSTGA
ncbi:alpha/beta fold hydrolase [Rhizobium metallidurans]|uniref:Pyruvate dehydrogenase E2 component (Dihydrolipoamide acetyltransferase) n=1 Tax=Rhizobium metallidurans TaxID=1265931 RepID=A0A7W6D031_9HYPH|nr:alpha/beta fold hydrolase [Rhizobium metallidurans]MBB3966785.1 pyruvate dehydrogenase E2 component (dihydrolipoamide acetyltransferase) [Rhizobium metallidurans]